jgi:hypothetical protein
MGSVMSGSEQAITGQSGFMRPVVVVSPVWTAPTALTHAKTDNPNQPSVTNLDMRIPETIAAYVVKRPAGRME